MISIINYTYTAIFTCGMCLDGLLLSYLPFQFYWFLIFIIWTLIVGPFIYYRVKKNNISENNTQIDKQPLRHFKNPALYILIYIILALSLSPFTLAAVITPFALLSPIWISHAVIISKRSTVITWSRANKILLTILVLCIPLSYIKQLTVI